MYPRVTYEFYSGNAKNIYDNIERGLLDVGLMSEPFDIQEFNFISMPTEEQWGLLVRKDSLLANKESIQPQDLVEVPLILPRLTHGTALAWKKDEVFPLATKTFIEFSKKYFKSISIHKK